jgi:hypothetical protein
LSRRKGKILTQRALRKSAEDAEKTLRREPKSTARNGCATGREKLSI